MKKKAFYANRRGVHLKETFDHTSFGLCPFGKSPSGKGTGIREKRTGKLILAILLIISMLIAVPGQKTFAAAAPTASVTKKTIYIGGNNYKITLKNTTSSSKVTYSSANSKIARVTTGGVIKPVAVGKTTVTVKIAQSGKTYTSNIAVTVRNPYVKISNAVEELTVGDTYKFEGKTYGLVKSSIIWKVSNSTVAKINSGTRVLTALKEGTVKVWMKDEISGLKTSCTITILPEPVEEPEEPEEELEESELFEYEIEDEKAIITSVYDYTVTTLVIPDTLSGRPVTKIDDGALEGLSDMTRVTIPATVTEIGDYAFGSCSSLKTITLPSKLVSIGDNAFEYCSALTSITIPSTVTTIGEYAFSSCEALKTVTLSDSLTELGDNAFEYCTALTSIAIPRSLAVIADSTFTDCSSLSKITFSTKQESIGDYAFANCVSLTSVTLPSTLVSLGSGAFDSCENLKNVTIPASVEDIGGGAFDYCSESLKLKVRKNSAGYEYAVDYEVSYTTY